MNKFHVIERHARNTKKAKSFQASKLKHWELKSEFSKTEEKNRVVNNTQECWNDTNFWLA